MVFWGGIVFMGFGLFLMLKSLLLSRRCSESVTGTVVQIGERVDQTMPRCYKAYYFPVYAYQVDGVEYRSAGKEYSRKRDKFEVGAQGEVRYNPNKHSECVINDKIGYTFIAEVFLVVGFFLSFV